MFMCVEGLPGLRKHCLAKGLASKMNLSFRNHCSEYVLWASKSMCSNPRRWTFSTMLAALGTYMRAKGEDEVVVGSAETSFRCYSPILREYMCAGETQLLGKVAQHCHRLPDVTVYVDGSLDNTMVGVGSRDHLPDFWLTWKRVDGLKKCYDQVMKSRRNVYVVPALDYSSEANVDRVVEGLRVFLSSLE